MESRLVGVFGLDDLAFESAAAGEFDDVCASDSVQTANKSYSSRSAETIIARRSGRVQIANWRISAAAKLARELAFSRSVRSARVLVRIG